MQGIREFVKIAGIQTGMVFGDRLLVNLLKLMQAETHSRPLRRQKFPLQKDPAHKVGDQFL